MNHSTELYVELFKRKEWDKIPIGIDSHTGEYYYLTKKQIKAIEYMFDHNISFIGYGGSARSGKTILECFLITFMSLAYPDTGWFIGRKELKRLRLTVLKSLLKLFSFYGIRKDEDYKYNQQDSIITFNNKSDIFLLDLDSRPSDPEHLWTGGYEFTGGCIDESNECTESMVIAINARCGWRNNDKYNIPQTTLESFNPDKGHVNRRYWIPFRDNKELEHQKFIRALPTDNPHPSVKTWVKNMRKTGDKKRIERLVDGNFDYDCDPTKLFEYQSIVAMWSNDHAERGKRYITCDVARLGADSTVIFVWDGWQIIYGERFSKKRTNQTVDRLNQLKREYGVMTHNVIVDEDGVGGGVVDHGNFTGFINGSKAKNGENYNNLKSQCYFEIADVVNDGRIYIKVTDLEIKTILIEDLEQMKDWNADKDQKKSVIPKEEVKEQIGRSPDCSDAFMMRMLPELVPEAQTGNPAGLM